MRKILLILVLILIPTFANAGERFKAGTWELMISSDLPPEPTIGYFFVDNVEGIVQISYSKTNNNYPSKYYDTTETDIIILGGLRYNFLNNSSKENPIVPFVEGGLVKFSSDTNYKGASSLDSSTDALGITVGAGLRFLVGDKAAVNAGLDFSTLDKKEDDINITGDVLDFAISYSLFF